MINFKKMQRYNTCNKFNYEKLSRLYFFGHNESINSESFLNHPINFNLIHHKFRFVPFIFISNKFNLSCSYFGHIVNKSLKYAPEWMPSWNLSLNLFLRSLQETLPGIIIKADLIETQLELSWPIGPQGQTLLIPVNFITIHLPSLCWTNP